MAITKVDPPPINNQNMSHRMWTNWFERIKSQVNQTITVVGGLQEVPVLIVDSSTLNLDGSGVAVGLIAATATAKVVLPEITSDLIGTEIKVTLNDATFNGEIELSGTDTISGYSGITMNMQWMTIDVFAQALGQWVII